MLFTKSLTGHRNVQTGVEHQKTLYGHWKTRVIYDDQYQKSVLYHTDINKFNTHITNQFDNPCD